VQVVLPEDLCQRLADLAEEESRTVSNMAKVLIQQGVERLEAQRSGSQAAYGAMAYGQAGLESADRFRQSLEQREQQPSRRLRGAPRRLRLQRP
jgi:predicted DNA-binding protein